MTTNTADGFDELLRYVDEELSFATTHYNEAYLDRRLAARMRRTDAESYADYLDTLEADPAEGRRLLESLSIPVSGFFRNPEMWEVLAGVLRTLTAENRRVDVWSAACADGREPYSLAALALDDPEIDATPVSITGTDISEAALARAREGVYEARRTSDIARELAPLSDPDRYVRREGDRFIVTERVKRLVEFERHDVIRDGAIGAVHLLLCRNLVIYIDHAHKAQILSTLDAALSPGGYLVIGMAETLPADYRDRFEPVGDRSRIFRRLP